MSDDELRNLRITVAEDLLYQRSLEEAIQRVRNAAAEWVRDDEEHLNRVGQHLGASITRMAELVLAALDGPPHD